MSDFKDAIEPVKVSISQLEELIGATILRWRSCLTELCERSGFPRRRSP